MKKNEKVEKEKEKGKIAEDNKEQKTESEENTTKMEQKFAHIPEWIGDDEKDTLCPTEFSCFIPYNLVSQHSIPGIDCPL